MVISSSRQSSPQLFLSPESREPSPRPSSAFEDFTLFDVPDSRRNSGVFASSSSSPRSAMGTNPPTLTEILLDVASPPWTLSAFTAYLSQNHCMETIEFTLDLQRYAAVHDQIQADKTADPAVANQQLSALWDKLMQVYIVPCAPREINIPSRVRDRLLRLPSQPEPPHPRELEEAGRIIHELMNDSLLVPFLESVSPMHLESSVDDHHRSPVYPPYLNVGKGTGSRCASTHAIDSEGLTDDSDGHSPPAHEPMTPPTTPPTSADWVNSSPGGLQRAMAAHNKGWKKVGAKLGFKSKPTTKRSPPTSSAPASEGSRSNNPL